MTHLLLANTMKIRIYAMMPLVEEHGLEYFDIQRSGLIQMIGSHPVALLVRCHKYDNKSRELIRVRRLIVVYNVPLDILKTLGSDMRLMPEPDVREPAMPVPIDEDGRLHIAGEVISFADGGACMCATATKIMKHLREEVEPEWDTDCTPAGFGGVYGNAKYKAVYECARKWLVYASELRMTCQFRYLAGLRVSAGLGGCVFRMAYLLN